MKRVKYTIALKFLPEVNRNVRRGWSGLGNPHTELWGW